MATSVVRLRRRGGVVVQDADVYIGRRVFMGGWRLPASPWANPFPRDPCVSSEEACRRYETWLRGERPDLLARLPELRGKTLGCWCAPGPCHGDVLIRLLAEADAQALPLPPAPGALPASGELTGCIPAGGGERSDPPNGSGAKRSSIDTILGNQPPEEEYAPPPKELRQNEARFAAGEALQPILVRNKDLLARALKTLPLAGQPQ